MDFIKSFLTQSWIYRWWGSKEVCCVKKSQERLVHTEKPAEEYLCYSELTGGRGRDLAKDVIEIVDEHKSREFLVAVVADGSGEVGDIGKWLYDPLVRQQVPYDKFQELNSNGCIQMQTAR